MELRAGFAALEGMAQTSQWRKKLVLITTVSNAGGVIVVAIPV